MKKLSFLTLLAFSVGLWSCTNDEPFVNIADEQKAVDPDASNIRSVEEVLEIVSENYGAIFQGHNSRAMSLTPKDVVVFGSNKASRSAASDTAIYVVNFGDNNGYAVVAANKECTPLLALTDNGEITNIDDIEIPGLKAFMDASILYAITPGAPDKPKPGGSLIINPDPILCMERVVTTTTRDHKPAVKVMWGQDWPTGYFCTNKISGCVVTAGVQALSYFELPTSINLTYPERDQNYQSFNWASLKENVASSYSSPSNFSNVSHLEDYLALARISREIGHRINANYDSPYGTAASIVDLRKVFLNITPELEISQIYDKSPDVPNLKRWDLIIMRGSLSENEKANGHAWILDGYKEKIDHVKVYAVDHPLYDENGNFIPAGDPVSVYDSPVYQLSHINWGWDGSNNGYYDVNVYDPAKCKEYDTAYNYSVSQDFKYYIRYFTMFK
ncbi:MAG: C10 family peptidase [Clostridium sp.]|nr:C10 family peptidase [Clostridium sp.]